MRVHCNECGDVVSNELPEGSLVAGWTTCGGCIEKEDELGMKKDVCCEYCKYKESSECPVQNANNWSRWKDYCSKFTKKDN